MYDNYKHNQTAKQDTISCICAHYMRRGESSKQIKTKDITPARKSHAQDGGGVATTSGMCLAKLPSPSTETDLRWVSNEVIALLPSTRLTSPLHHQEMRR
eukprot:scpid107056/ scgid35327/ 